MRVMARYAGWVPDAACRVWRVRCPCGNPFLYWLRAGAWVLPSARRAGPGRYTWRLFSHVSRSIRVFESLTQRLSGTIERLRGRGRLSESNISEALREVRIALLEADVALPVVQAVVQRIQVRAVGQEVLKSLTPGQALIKIVRDELTLVMGAAASDLDLNVPAPAVILMAGLQGAGKTTTVAKLAKHLKDKRKKKVMVVSADVYRPAAIEQLRTLAQQVDVMFFPSPAEQKPETTRKN